MYFLHSHKHSKITGDIPKMCKRKVRSFKWSYMINDNENEVNMKKRSSRFDINRPNVTDVT